MDLIPEILSKYAEAHTSEESVLLNKINRETHLHVLQSRMLSGHLQGRLLSFISQMIRPKYILEIGTYTGYSALCLAEGLQKDGKIITIDKNEELKPKVKKYIEESGYGHQIELMTGIAKEIIPGLDYPWDLVFIDADKENYPTYFDQTIDRVRSGGCLIADNVLWSGKVADPEKTDQVTQTIREFNDKVHQDTRVENILLPIRDGLMILRKK